MAPELHGTDVLCPHIHIERETRAIVNFSRITHPAAMKTGYLIAAMALLTAPNTAFAATEPLLPTGQWVVDFAEHQCVASREYGGDRRYFLVLKPAPAGDVVQLTLLHEGSGPREAREIDGQITIDGQPTIDVRILDYRASGQRMRMSQINLTADQFAPLRTATRLSIDARRGPKVDLRLSQMPALTEQIDACLDDLRQHWHIDEAVRAAVPAEETADFRGLFTASDYPAISNRRGDGGRVRVVLLIDEAGKVADCMVTNSSGVPALDVQTCIVLRDRARFRPAHGADGRPMRSYTFPPPIIWKLY